MLWNYSVPDNEPDCLTGELTPAEVQLRSQAFCGRHWDHLLCWPLTPAETTLAIQCNASKSFVEIVTTSSRSVKTADIPGVAFLHCNGSGIWADKTDYEQCMTFLNEIMSEEASRGRVRHAVSIITFVLCLTSALLLLVALAIFGYFKSLKCDRLRVHKNFMISLVIRYLVSVVYYEPFIYGQDDPQVWYKDSVDSVVCKLILVLLLYGNISPVFWMFIEGAYLHSRVVTNVFDSPAPFKVYYLIGWVLPFVCILTWSLTMILAFEDKTNTCWEGYTDESYLLIISIPMILALTANLLFLVNIVRIVVRKASQSNARSEAVTSSGVNGGQQSTSERAHFLKAVRATVILFPLLGITNLLFFINPKNGTHEKLYMLFNATMQSSQGIFLAILYCFCNSEVQDTIRRCFRRIATRSEMRRSTVHRNASTRNRNNNNNNGGGLLSGASITASSRRATITAMVSTSSPGGSNTRTSSFRTTAVEMEPLKKGADGQFNGGSDGGDDPGAPAPVDPPPKPPRIHAS